METQHSDSASSAVNAPGGDRERRIDFERLSIMMRQARPAYMATIINSLIIVYVLKDVIPALNLALWCSALLVLTLLRLGHGVLFRRYASVEKDFRVWYVAFAIGAILAGMTWGSSAIFLYSETSEPHRVFLALMVVGIATGASGSLAPSRLISFAFILLTVAPLPIRFFLSGGDIHNALGVLTLILVVLLLSMATYFRKTIMTSLHLRFENSELVETLTIARDQAEGVSKVKTQFLANMSHEIRTPMNGVLGMLELLQGTNLSDQQSRFATTAQRSGESLLNVINDVLDFSRIEAGKLKLETIDFDLREVVEDVADLMAEQAHRKGLELVCLIDDDVPAIVQGDPHRLRQVLTNLIGNAVKFTSKGEVVIHVAQAGSDQSPANLYFEVRDTGIGIAPAAQKRVFDSFVQADGSTTRSYGGSGLGLAIVDQLCTMMGGKVGLKSEVGKGSTFWFSASIPAATSTRASLDEARVGLRGVRALIVDDNETNRSLLTHQLGNWGLSSATAESGEQAWQMLHEALSSDQPYQMAVLDMHMPGMDGLQLAQKIKADPGLSDMRLAMLTSVGQYGDVDQAREVGIESYMSKPVRQTQLYDCLATLMHGRVDGPPIQPVQPAGTARRKPMTGAKILCVEDNPVNREVALSMLEDLGYQVTMAEHGEQALMLLGEAPFELVLMDCQMPVMDGFEATRALRTKESASPDSNANRLPIIALTAHAMEGDRKACIDAGMDDYLSKPFSQAQLQAMLERWLPHETEVNLPESYNSSPKAVEAVLDIAPLDAIRALEKNGRENMLARIIEMYTKDSARLIENIQTGISAGDANAVMNGAHSLKSSSANLGATELTELCRRVEHQSRSDSLEGLGQDMETLVRVHAAVVEALALQVKPND